MITDCYLISSSPSHTWATSSAGRIVGNGCRPRAPTFRPSGGPGDRQFPLYLETDQFQSVSLPYGTGALSFEVILPAPGTNLATLSTQLTPETWQSWMNQRRSRPGAVPLPKFQGDGGTGNSKFTSITSPLADRGGAATRRRFCLFGRLLARSNRLRWCRPGCRYPGRSGR